MHSGTLGSWTVSVRRPGPGGLLEYRFALLQAIGLYAQLAGFQNNYAL